MIRHVDLIRHAESLDNLRPSIIGGRNTSIPLSEKGEHQAIALGLHYKLGNDALLLSSPAVRAVRTGELAFPSHNIETDDRFSELFQGDHEGQERLLVHTPDIVSSMNRLDWDYRAPNGESWCENAERMHEGIENHSKDSARLVVISHVTSIRALTGMIKGLTQQEAFKTQRIDNTTISRLIDYGKGWEVEFIGKQAEEIERS